MTTYPNYAFHRESATAITAIKMSKTVSRDDVLAVMPHPVLTRITGEPTYQAMKHWKKEMQSNLLKVSMPDNWGRGKGLIGELQDPAVFIARNGAAYNPPLVAPPNYPVIPPGSTTQQREELRAENATNKEFWDKAEHGRQIAVTIGSAALEDWTYAELDDPDEGLNSVQVIDLYNHIMDRYAKISQSEIDANLKSFNEGIDPTKTLAIYIRKQERCQEIALDARVPIDESSMVTTGTKHAVATGSMDEAWKTWKRRPIVDHTWANWKSHWTDAFQEKRELIQLTGTAFNGMAHQAREAEDDAMGEQMVTALDNLANAAVQKNDTVEQLVKANSTLTLTIKSQQEEIKRLHNILENLSTKNTGTAPAYEWEKNGYCYWHGYKVSKGHTSANCKKGKHAADYEQHKNAKRGDEQGGSVINKGWENK